MKKATREAIGTFEKMATKSLNGAMFTSWRTPDNKQFFLAPTCINLNIPRFGVNVDDYAVSYTLLGQMDFIR